MNPAKTNQDRRRLLQWVRSGLVASCAASLLPALAGAAKPLPPTALLLPLTGPHAALGRSMARAGTLAQGSDRKALLTLDTGGTPAGAMAAAAEALKRGAGLILGPVFAPEVQPVIDTVGGRVPIVSFSNDAALLEHGAFLLGITADQAVAPLLAYARGRGVQRIAIAPGNTAWDRQVAAAAGRAAQRTGLTIVTGEADAQLVSGDPNAMAAAARALRGSGVQMLGASAALDADPALLAALEGAWLSAPDPAAFADFATAFEGQNGSPPGVIAGLAYDAVRISGLLRQGGGTDRSALLAAQGFRGVCGDLRFRDDGSAQRSMAILAVDAGRYRLVDHGAA
jgi:ABC-type branched-subunit amino acid transport system substrate-binding protein